MMPNKKSLLFNKLYQRAHKGFFVWRWIYSFYTEYVLGCEIKASTKIGENLEIYHGARGSVVSPGAVIGNNVSLCQNFTIGSKDFKGAEKSPVIEDDVTIGPNAYIIGDVRIGWGGGGDWCGVCCREGFVSQFSCCRKFREDDKNVELLGCFQVKTRDFCFL